MTKEEKNINRIPVSTEMFGREIRTIFDSNRLDGKNVFGEARYRSNTIALTDILNGITIPDDELKMTYIHELIHFILVFTGYDPLIVNQKSFDLEQFVELLSSGIYQGLFKNIKY